MRFPTAFTTIRPFWLLWGGLALGAVTMAVLAARYDYLAFDLWLARRLQADAGFLWPLFRLLNMLGAKARMLIAAAIIGYSLLRRWPGRLTAYYLLVPLLVGPVEKVVKLLVARPRPSAGLIRVNEFPDDTSFPSGHVTNAVIFFGYLFIVTEALFPDRRVATAVRACCAAIIVLMGPARVYGGAHWPSDALGGYLVGGTVLMLVVWGYRRLLNHEGERRRGEREEDRPEGLSVRLARGPHSDPER